MTTGRINQVSFLLTNAFFDRKHIVKKLVLTQYKNHVILENQLNILLWSGCG
jgi:hypothetical protein